MMTKHDPASKPQKPTLLKKSISGANWGMLAGFWVELPMMAAFLFKPFKPVDLAGWAKVSEWSVKLVLPATLAGVVYGFTKPERDAPIGQAQAHAAHGESESARKDTRKWAAAEEARRANDEDLHIQI